MTIVRYEPWSFLNRFYREASNPVNSNVAWLPSVDVHEEENRFVVQVDLPGVDSKDIEITAEKGVLTIKGERKSESKKAEVGYERVERVAGTFLRHVKPHGAMYNRAARDPEMAGTIARAIFDLDPTLVLVGLAGSASVAAASAAGLRVAAEGFADRRYEADGSLRSRRLNGALLGPRDAAAQAVSIARDRRVTAQDGSTRPVEADTICVHGDGPEAVAVARAVRAALEKAGVVVAALGDA